MRLIAAPTPERGGKYIGDVTKSVASWFEDRLRFLSGLPTEMQPPTTWMATQLEMATARWTRGEGHKRRAAQLIESIEHEPDQCFPATTIKRAATALDAWLARDLVDTEEDWMPYLERLEEVHGVRLDGAEDIAAKFERHALGELERWSPSPPDLMELIEYAKRFQLDELAEVLGDKAREDDRREEEAADRRREDQSPSARLRTISDAELGQMFARLAPNRSATESTTRG